MSQLCIKIYIVITLIFMTYPPAFGAGDSSRAGKAPKDGRCDIVTWAKRCLGKPYVWGGNGRKGYDCSGFVRAAYNRYGLRLPRSSAAQYRVGTSVSRSALRPGDRVFFSTYRRGPSHVGIYIGNDKFIHASSSKRRITIDRLSSRYYRARYIGARR
ncbi:MAG: C40 family peptidase [bacterium]|nr:C40 family peptidase [bacterium]MDD4152591.1 C40 family peptidase [bacterium]